MTPFLGLTVGMSSLAAGLAIGIVGDAGVRANAQQPRLFVAWRSHGENFRDGGNFPENPRKILEHPRKMMV